ncbi:MAG: hypothetical protein P8176_01295 [Gammaproteobacteria bacterium]
MAVFNTCPFLASRSVILYLAPPRKAILVKLVNMVAEELHCRVLGLPAFDWSAFEIGIDNLLQHENCQRAIEDLSHYDHVAVATFSEKYPALLHQEWLHSLHPDHASAVKPLARKALSFISVGDGATVPESFRLVMQRSAMALDMSFLDGVYVQTEGSLRYSCAADHVIEYVGRVSQFYAK